MFGLIIGVPLCIGFAWFMLGLVKEISDYAIANKSVWTIVWLVVFAVIITLGVTAGQYD